VPCEWAACEPVILVWYWCPVNRQLVGQLCWYGTSADLSSCAGMERVLVVQLCWFGTEVL